MHVVTEMLFRCRLAGVPVDFEDVHLDSTVQGIDNVHDAITLIKRNGVAIKGIDCKFEKNLRIHSLIFVILISYVLLTFGSCILQLQKYS